MAPDADPMPPDMGGPNSVANKLFKLQMQGGVHQLGIEEQKTRLQRINADTRRAREELLRLKAEKKEVGGTFAGRYRNKHNQRQVGCWCIWCMVTAGTASLRHASGQRSRTPACHLMPFGSACGCRTGAVGPAREPAQSSETATRHHDQSTK